MEKGCGMVPFIAILATSLAGLIDLPWWTTLFGISLLFFVSCREQARLHDRLSAIRAIELSKAAYVSSLVNAASACVAAYALGQLTRLALGA